MLGARDAAAMVAVKDLDVARRFYEDTLGLTPEREDGGDAIAYRSGSSTVVVYASQFAGTNQATSVAWSGGEEFDAIVDGLRERGVSFEHYDMPGIEREGDVHIGG